MLHEPPYNLTASGRKLQRTEKSQELPTRMETLTNLDPLTISNGAVRKVLDCSKVDTVINEEAKRLMSSKKSLFSNHERW